MSTPDANRRSQPPAAGETADHPSAHPTNDSSGATASHPAGSPAMPEFVGRFRVLSVLGEGTYGTVYRARDEQLGRDVAVKVPKDVSGDRVGRFLREARALATLRHPNVCPVYETGEDGGRPYIVMALVAGGSLAAWLDGRLPLPPAEAARAVHALARALAAAHAKGVIHRDLKPANVLRDAETGDLVVTDFGLARLEQPGTALVTPSGEVMGTPAYMAPEQARGESAAVGPATDVYSLGVILYELLAGVRPFRGTFGEVIGMVQHVAPVPPSAHRPGLDPRLESVCLAAMAKDPASRPPSAAAFADALTPFLVDAPAQSPPRRHRWWVALAAGAMAAAIAGVIFFARTPTATVMVNVDVDLADRTLTYTLDGKPVTAAELAKPIELTVGDHEFTARRGAEAVRRYAFAVSRDAGARIELREPPVKPPEPPAKVAELPAGGERAVATWLLERGEELNVELPEGKGVDARKVADLPPGPFRTRTALVNKPATAADVARVASLRHLRHLRLSRCDAGDAVLLLLSGLTELEVLELIGDGFTDAGLNSLKPLAKLKHLRGLGGATGVGLAGLRHLPLVEVTLGRPNDAGLEATAACLTLESVAVGGNGFTAAGLRHLAGLPNLTKLVAQGCATFGDDELVEVVKHRRLRILNLNQTRVTDRGLAHLAALPDLRDLSLHATATTDAGVEQLASLPQLTTLILRNTSATDAAMARLASAKNLRALHLDDTAVTDEGLKRLADSTSLRLLTVRNTRVTEAGIFAFAAKCSACRVEPVPSRPDREVAEWAVRNGAHVTVGVPGKPRTKVMTSDQIPAGPIRVYEFHKPHQPFRDADASRLIGLTSLEMVWLPQGYVVPNDRRLSDVALDSLRLIPSLRELQLDNTQVTNDGIARLKELKGLRSLSLAGTSVTPAAFLTWYGHGLERLIIGRVTDENITGLLPLTNLTFLDLCDCRDLTAVGIRKLAPLKQIAVLKFSRMSLSDDAAECVASIWPGLTYLSFYNSPLTDAGLKHVARLRHLQEFRVNDIRVSDRGLLELKVLDTLRTLYLAEMQVAAETIAELKQALPKCTIHHTPPRKSN